MTRDLCLRPARFSDSLTHTFISFMTCVFWATARLVAQLVMFEVSLLTKQDREKLQTYKKWLQNDTSQNHSVLPALIVVGIETIHTWFHTP